MPRLLITSLARPLMQKKCCVIHKRQSSTGKQPASGIAWPCVVLTSQFWLLQIVWRSSTQNRRLLIKTIGVWKQRQFVIRMSNVFVWTETACRIGTLVQPLVRRYQRRSKEVLLDLCVASTKLTTYKGIDSSLFIQHTSYCCVAYIVLSLS